MRARDRLSQLQAALRDRSVRLFSRETIALAEQLALQARTKVDIDTWAAALARDVAGARD